MADQQAAASEPTEETAVASDLDEFCAAEGQCRLWIRTIVPLLQLRSHESDPSPRVQYASDQMCIAAYERITRILRSDIGDQEQ